MPCGRAWLANNHKNAFAVTLAANQNKQQKQK
jgi:hypothetical protein